MMGGVHSPWKCSHLKFCLDLVYMKVFWCLLGEVLLCCFVNLLELCIRTCFRGHLTLCMKSPFPAQQAVRVGKEAFVAIPKRLFSTSVSHTGWVMLDSRCESHSAFTLNVSGPHELLKLPCDYTMFLHTGVIVIVIVKRMYSGCGR